MLTKRTVHKVRVGTWRAAIVKAMNGARGFGLHGSLVAATGVAIALLCAIGWYADQASVVRYTQNVASSTAPLVTTRTVGSTTTYINHQFNFSITYPSTLVATASSSRWGVNMANLSRGKVVLVLPGVSQGGSTRGAFLVLASAATDDLRNCTTTTVQTEGGNPPLQIASINGATFAHYETGQPALGQFSADSVYKIQRGNVCLAIDETYDGIETSHLSGATATQNAADMAAVASELDGIMQSWRFLAPAHPAPACTLSVAKSSYAVGDPIAFSWTSQNATSAWWETPTNTSSLDMFVSPPGTPGVSGRATTTAAIAGSHTIALDVEGPGGLASCRAGITVGSSNVQLSVPHVELVYPQSGSQLFGGVQKIYWTVPQNVINSFPSGYNLSLILNAESQSNPGVLIPINDGNAFLSGVANWNLAKALTAGQLTPGTYRVIWHLEANPTDYSQACAQVVNNQCEPSAAAQQVMQQAQQITGETGWFTVAK